MAQPKKKPNPPTQDIGSLLGTADAQAPTGAPDLSALGAGAAGPPDPTAVDAGGVDPGAAVGTDAGQQDQFEVDQLQQALNDPNLSPQDRMILQQRLEIAARRSLAGMGGPSQ